MTTMPSPPSPPPSSSSPPSPPSPPLPPSPSAPPAAVEFVSRELLERLSAQARQSPRLRKNYNFHASDDALCHRLLNAMEPDSYIQPHRHLDANKDETLVVIRGRLGLVLFDPEGRVTDKALLEAGGPVLLVNIPHGTFHAWVCLEPGSVFFEAKAGPFVPLNPAEKASWAPPEGDPAAPACLAALKKLLEP